MIGLSISTRELIACMSCCFFQAEDGIRDLVRSRGLGDVYKRQHRYTDLTQKKFSYKTSSY